jgi:hypothetical protein
MSERYKPKDLQRDAAERWLAGERPASAGSSTLPPRRSVIGWRDGKPVVIEPTLCRLHGIPWMQCAACSKPKAK